MRVTMVHLMATQEQQLTLHVQYVLLDNTAPPMAYQLQLGTVQEVGTAMLGPGQISQAFWEMIRDLTVTAQLQVSEENVWREHFVLMDPQHQHPALVVTIVKLMNFQP